MRAAVLHEFGSPLRLDEVDDPVAGSGEVVVDVLAAPVQNYAAEVFSGKRPMVLELPISPGPGGDITVHGQWMYPRTAVGRMISMITSGQVSLDHVAITEFDLDDVAEAVEHAAANAGPFRTTVLRPVRP